jgi:hypothetical protein
VIEATGRAGFIYLMKPDNMPHKIGFSVDADARKRQINLALPYEPHVIHLIKTNDMLRAEAYFHEQFADRRLRGEWFELTVEDVEWIRSVGEWNHLTVVTEVERVVERGFSPYQLAAIEDPSERCGQFVARIQRQEAANPNPENQQSMWEAIERALLPYEVSTRIDMLEARLAELNIKITAKETDRLQAMEDALQDPARLRALESEETP